MDSRNRHAHLQSFGARACGLFLPQDHNEIELSLRNALCSEGILQRLDIAIILTHHDTLTRENKRKFSVLQSCEINQECSRDLANFHLLSLFQELSLWILIHVKTTFTKNIGNKKIYTRIHANSKLLNICTLWYLVTLYFTFNNVSVKFFFVLR